jgi:nicotinate-nucleotide adenylyltransferase
LKTRRIGIYAGTFNPVHAGHVAFALQAIETAKLDMVYFLPERQPRHKTGVEHFAHRVAMLKRAAQPHPRFGVLELTDVNFTPERTMPKLRQKFGRSQLIFLFGSDVISGLNDWPKVDRLLMESELVIGLRDQSEQQVVDQQIAACATQPKAVTIFSSYAPDVSSGRVREALRRRVHTQGLLASVRRYSDHNWLYVSLA